MFAVYLENLSLSLYSSVSLRIDIQQELNYMFKYSYYESIVIIVDLSYERMFSI